MRERVRGRIAVVIVVVEGVGRKKKKECKESLKLNPRGGKKSSYRYTLDSYEPENSVGVMVISGRLTTTSNDDAPLLAVVAEAVDVNVNYDSTPVFHTQQ